jgi:hypothetical protein
MTGYEIDNRLFELVNSEQISVMGYAVGHYIKKIQNQKGIKYFHLMISSMATTLGISRQSASKYFDELVSCDFIEIVERTSNKGIKITIKLESDVKSDVKNINIKTSDVKGDVKDDVKGDVKSDVKNFNTLKKEERRIKNKELDILNTREKISETWNEIKNEKSVEELWSPFMNLVQQKMYLFKSTLKLSDEQLNEQLDTFKTFVTLKEKTYRNEHKFFDHFINWRLTYKPSTKKEEFNTKQMTSDEISEIVANKLINQNL